MDLEECVRVHQTEKTGNRQSEKANDKAWNCEKDWCGWGGGEFIAQVNWARTGVPFGRQARDLGLFSKVDREVLSKEIRF